MEQKFSCVKSRKWTNSWEFNKRNFLLNRIFLKKLIEHWRKENVNICSIIKNQIARKSSIRNVRLSWIVLAKRWTIFPRPRSFGWQFECGSISKGSFSWIDQRFYFQSSSLKFIRVSEPNLESLSLPFLFHLIISSTFL